MSVSVNGKPHPVIDGRITNVAVGGSKRTTFPMLKDENGQIKETVPDFELRVQGLVAKAKACICDLGTSRAAPVSDCTALHRRRTLPRPQPLPQPNRHHRRRPGRSARPPTARACRPSSPSTASRRQSRRSRARAAAQGTCGAAAKPVRAPPLVAALAHRGGSEPKKAGASSSDARLRSGLGAA